MFFVYYIIVALITFWAVATHQATRGKPFVALLSAAIMPFALPLIPVVGLLMFAYKKFSPATTASPPLPQMRVFTPPPQSRFTVGDESLLSAPQNDDEILDLCAKVAQSLARRLSTEQEVYWFVVEQYDRLSEHGGKVQELISRAPLFEIEHRGSRSETSYVGKPNPGVVFLDQKVTPPLESAFGHELAQRMRATIYVLFREGFKDEVQRLRVKYAAHYHNNCITNGHFNKADEWSEAISAIEAGA